MKTRPTGNAGKDSLMTSNRKIPARHRRISLGPLNCKEYEKHKNKIAVIMGNFMLRHLNRLYQEFDGDMVQAIVLGEIGHHNITNYFSGDEAQPGMDDSLWDTPIPWQNLRPCNAFSISEATGIPRETVRRKIAVLARKGWVKRSPNGEVVITSAVQKYFIGGFNLLTCKDLLQTAERIRRFANSDDAHSK